MKFERKNWQYLNWRKVGGIKTEQWTDNEFKSDVLRYFQKSVWKLHRSPEELTDQMVDLFKQTLEIARCEWIVPLKTAASKKLRRVLISKYYPIIDRKLRRCFLIKESGMHSDLLGWLVLYHFLQEGNITKMCKRDKNLIKNCLKLLALNRKNDFLLTIYKLDNLFLKYGYGCYYSSRKRWYLSENGLNSSLEKILTASNKEK